MKISQLTDEQTQKFPIYRDKWIALGLTTQPKSLKEAKEDFINFQKIILKKESPAPVVLLDSPLKCWMAVCHFSSQGSSEKKTFHKSPIWNQVWDVLKEQLADQPSDALNMVSGKLPKLIKLDFIYPYFDCQFWAGFFAFYDYFKYELGIKFDNDTEYESLKRCQPYGMVFPLDNICIVCQPPTVLKKNANGLHCTNGPAVSYNGDNEIYALNGVIMSKEYIMTPGEQITPETILKESNVEIRRELFRKVGIERVMDKLPHKLLDKRDNYELFSIAISDEVKDARYLKMTNPSIGCFHMEGVAPQISTVNEALEWRNQNFFTDAEILT